MVLVRKCDQGESLTIPVNVRDGKMLAVVDSAAQITVISQDIGIFSEEYLFWL